MTDLRVQRAIASELDKLERLGADVDLPEGSRYILMSDTLAKKLSAALRGRSVGTAQTCMLCGKPVPPDIPNMAAYICPECVEKSDD